VPDSCRLTIDRRFLLEEDLGDVKGEVVSILERLKRERPATRERGGLLDRRVRGGGQGSLLGFASLNPANLESMNKRLNTAKGGTTDG